MNSRRWLRVGLAFLALVQAGVGGWALLAPRSFFAIPWVGMGMAYNSHLMADYGAMSLATSVALATAAVVLRRDMVRMALAVYLTFAVPHLVIHIRLLHHLAPSQRTPLLLALTIAVVLPAALLALATPRPPAERGGPAPGDAEVAEHRTGSDRRGG
ncbi:hypothetical protein [Streptomyces sp. 891-h]|uniref:hypothetical protein n=1 Tax=Streptomyces sp. 891-h TaxID=2720714 RepID=UPI001FA964CD|nr:hypothetical protein [Streptomyces sp. 891-h]